MSRRTLTAVATRLTGALVGWWALTGGSVSAPVLTAAIIVSSVGLSLAVVPPGRAPRPIGTARLLGFFVGASLRGGVDVARRALAPGPVPISPGFVERELRLPPGAPRLLCAGCLSLLPGSASVELAGERLTVHLLDTGMPIDGMLDALERHIADAFGVRLEPSG